MPGLSQLKKFSEDIANLGNELTIREEKGESIIQVPLPTGISEEDDSEDFVLGMPLGDRDTETEEELEAGFENDVIDANSNLTSADVDYSAFPELDSLLNPEPVESMDLSDFPELDAILNPQSEDTSATDTVESVPEDFDSPSDAVDLSDLGVETAEDDNEVEFSFDDKLPSDDTSPLDDFSASFPESAPMEDIESFEQPSPEENLRGSQDIGDFSFEDLPDFSVESDDDFSEPQEIELSSDGKPEGLDDFENLSSLDSSLFPEDTGNNSQDVNFQDSNLQDVGLQDADSSDFNLPDLDSLDFSSPDSDTQGDDFSDSSFDLPETDLGSSGEEEGSAVSDSDSGTEAFAGGFDLPDFDTISNDFSDEFLDTQESSSESLAEQPVEDSPEDFNIQDDNFSLETGSENPQEKDNLNSNEASFSTDFESEEKEAEAPDFSSVSVDVPDFNTDFSEEGENQGDEFSESETYDSDDDSNDSFDVEQPSVGEKFDDFDIPGFSDQAAGANLIKPKKIGAGKNGAQEKNTLTDKEYKTFLQNLKNYPLNLRIELEKFIVGDEFKDDVVYEVIQKVIKKTSARQLATHLEKLLDISIPVPREFEKRTAEEYEEYKKSAEYQLKNRILPVAFISIMAACILFVIFLFGKNFVYEPLRANALYKEGYALLEEGAYPQSEIKFDEALTYQQQKRWFFTYADGYRRHKQYERARTMYRAGLQRFNQDKELGLDYAEMELYDLRNFENAETVVKREVLDYHINDPEGMLLLGDIYLEWGDERDPSKYEDAREVYDDILQLYGQQDLYLARMMRYHIRVDDLRNVLQMKEYFYPNEKSLGGQDLIELSGYLLDKISGNIKPADEYLLSSIEDVRELLERAVQFAPDVPESLYNMGLYFMNANHNTSAKDWLSAALESFEKAEYKPRKRLLRQLNTYRLLGDLDVENKEYISAEEKYRRGISFFEKAAEAGLEGDENVGRLYASLGDINYLITGDFDEALRNYSVAVNTKYDVPSINYKMGYINYSKKEYGEALNLFIKTAESMPTDTHVLLALGNVLSSRGDNFAAQGYYQRLIDILDQQMVRYGILFPNDNDDHKDFISMYNRAANNLGVTLSRLARQTGNSAMNAEALTNFTASLRAWDALTRDPETLVRREGSNLAEQNIRYMSMPVPDYEPSIYTEIPVQLEGEFIPK